MKDRKKTNGIFSWKNFQRVGVLVALLASIGTVIGVWFQLKKTNIEAEFRVLSSELITAPADIKELTSIFVFRGDTVKNMFRIKCRFLNTGDKTLVGQGPQQNILNNIRLSFPDEITILDKLIIPNESSLPFKVDILDNKSFSLEFSQWKKGEIGTILFFVKTDSVYQSTPLPTVMDRPIIDGNLRVRDFSNESIPQPTDLLDSFLPKSISQTTRVTSIITCSLMSILCLIAVIGILRNEIRVLKWKQNNISSVRAHYQVLGMNKIEIEQKIESIKLDPKKFKEWKAANVDSPPNITTDSTRTTLVLTLILIFLMIAFVSAALGNWAV